MNNILYIGPYKENNGLGRSSRRFLKALYSDKTINLCARPVYFTQNTIFDESEYDIIKFDDPEQNKADKYDVIIQHGYPDMFQYDRRFGKNIGIVEIETSNLQSSTWIDRINLLDEVIVGSIFSAESLKESGVIIPIKILPEPYNIVDVSNNDFFYYPDNNTRPFIFYTMGQYSEKKNIESIILAYLLEFNEHDNVKLFIKTGDYYTENPDLEQILSHTIKKIKKSVCRGNYDYPTIDIVCGILKETDISRLHNSADCYINAVRADGFGPCAIEAMLHNNIVINTKNIGSNTYINSSNALMVDSVKTRTYTSSYYNKSTFTTKEYWYEPIIDSLRSQMRKAYQMNNSAKNELPTYFNKDIFSYQNIVKNLLS